MEQNAGLHAFSHFPSGSSLAPGGCAGQQPSEHSLQPKQHRHMHLRLQRGPGLETQWHSKQFSGLRLDAIRSADMDLGGEDAAQASGAFWLPCLCWPKRHIRLD